jgi:hypothetical protein
MYYNNHSKTKIYIFSKPYESHKTGNMARFIKNQKDSKKAVFVSF